MPTVRSHRDLEVWQRSVALVEMVYQLTAKFPTQEQFGLTAQIRRAAVSVPSNIAEGAARTGIKDYSRFIGMARGSLAEVDTQLTLSLRLGFVESEDLLGLQEGGDGVRTNAYGTEPSPTKKQSPSLIA